jgi:recombination protein RecA
VKVVKNKVSPPFKIAEFEIIYGHGISREGEIIDIGVEHELIEKSGAWYSYQTERIGQGKENVRQFLLDNKAISEDLNTKIRNILLPDRNSESDEESKEE